jgi:hypothetical protein
VRRAIDPTVRSAAVRLRTEGRLSLNEIQALLTEPVARSTLCRWLRRHPLSSFELMERQFVNADRMNAANRGRARHHDLNTGTHAGPAFGTATAPPQQAT